jgi:hypothetical protein
MSSIDAVVDNMYGKMCPNCYGTIFPGEFHSCPAETSDFTLLRKENDTLRAQHVAEMDAKVEALEWRDKEICTLRKQLDAMEHNNRVFQHRGDELQAKMAHPDYQVTFQYDTNSETEDT